MDYLNFDDPLGDVQWGALFGVAFIIVNVLFPGIVIGYPTAQMGATEYTAILKAPIFEEFAFRFGLLSLTDTWLPLPFPFDVGINAVAFSIFHWSAYGLQINSALIGAGLFSILASWLAKERGILAAIVLHSIVNAWLVIGRDLIFLGIVQ